MQDLAEQAARGFASPEGFGTSEDVGTSASGGGDLASASSGVAGADGERRRMSEQQGSTTPFFTPLTRSSVDVGVGSSSSHNGGSGASLADVARD